jgi:glycosyltransferase involved in cell wall biosynthesis
MTLLPPDTAASETPTERLVSAAEWASAWVVVPAFNEGRVIGDTIEGLRAVATNIVVVDDCSSDDTARQLDGLPVTVLRHAVNVGQGAALQTGIEWALRHGALYLVTFDADGQHDPRDIPPLLTALIDQRLDIVLGSRFRGQAIGISRTRRLLLRTALAFTRLSTGLPVTDVHNGLRAFRAGAAPTLRITQDRMAHASEILEHIARARLAWAEVPTTVRYSGYSVTKGQSSLGAIDILFELMFGRLRR